MTYQDIIASIPHTFLELPAKEVFLREGEVDDRYFFIEEGAVRLWFDQDGKEITLNFFFEEEGVAAMESLLKAEPSRYYLETMKPSRLLVFQKEAMDAYLDTHPEAREIAENALRDMLFEYAGLFLSRIKDDPAERYTTLLKDRPDILRRVPQHYIASYLGITPVSLSRIRRRLVEVPEIV